MTQKNNNSEKVSFIGLGLMGSALARLLVKNGYRVTVWNRTSKKADSLIRDGAVLASCAAEAISANPVVVVCVRDYEATNEILNIEEAAPALAGKTIIQLSTGNPQEAREIEIWAQQHKAEYLDGAILAIPEQMGKPDTIILVSGAKTAFQKSEKILNILAGKITNLGEQVGAASAMDLAILSYTYGAALGFFHGARIIESEDIQIDSFGAIIADFSPTLGDFIKYESDVIRKENYTATESPIRLSAEAVERILKTARELGINTEFPTFASGIFQKAMDAGYGDEEIAALIKVFRRQGDVKEIGGAKNA